MKSTDKKIEEIKMGFNDDNTLIADIGSDMLGLMKNALDELGAEGKTVVITDPYLYSTHNDQTYIANIIDILTGLKASKIIYVTSGKIQDSVMENQVISALNAQGCEYEKKTAPKIHDRYWLCVENKKAVETGTSLNGIGKKISRIDNVSEGDVASLINILHTQMVI